MFLTRIYIIFICIGQFLSPALGEFANDRNSKVNVSLEGLRSTTVSRNGINYFVTDAGRQGEWYYDQYDHSSMDNSGTVIVSRNGLRFKRKWDQENVLPEWFGVKGDGATNETANLQKAINAANGKNLVFNAKSVYCFTYVALPFNIKLVGNGCTIRPWATEFSHNMAFFAIRCTRTSESTGLFTGTVKMGTKSTPRIFHDIEISGFNADFQYLTTKLLAIEDVKDYCRVENISCHDNHIINNSGNAIDIVPSQNLITDSSGKVEGLTIYNNTCENNGAFLRIVADDDQGAGTTSVKVRSLDPGFALAKKIMIGRYILFATDVKSGAEGLEGGTSFAQSNAIYRVTGFHPDQRDSLRGTIEIASGNYSTSAGWDADVGNKGLKIGIKKNAWIIPPLVYDYPLLFSFPKFNLVSGSNSITRSDSSAVENVFAKNLYPGLKVFFDFGIRGVYEIKSINGGEVQLSDALAANRPNWKMFAAGTLGNAVSLSPPFNNVVIRNNRFIGGAHGVSAVGGQGPGLTWDQINMSLTIDSNYMENMWMNIEVYSNDPLLNPFPLEGVTQEAGQTSISPKGQFYLHQKDINGDGKDELLFNNNPDIKRATVNNSLLVDDIFFLTGTKGFYKITALTNTTISFEKYDPITKKTMSGGLENAVGDGSPNKLQRVFTNTLGSNAIINHLNIIGNQLQYTIRPNFGGYQISMTGNNIRIENNTFKTIERICLEMNGNLVQVKGNKIFQSLWNTSDPLPGITNHSSSPDKKSAYPFILLSAANPEITNNEFTCDQPDNSDYSNQAGSIAITTRTSVPYVAEKCTISNNIFNGVRGRFFFNNAPKKIKSRTYNGSFWNEFIVQGNTFNILPNTPNLQLGILYGISKNVIENNNFNFVGKLKYDKLVDGDDLNPEIAGPGPYPIIISGNKFNGEAIPNASPVLSSKISSTGK